MSVRTDVSIDVTVSPRIVTVAAPSTSITIQDLHDTLRYLERLPWHMAHKRFLLSTGKDTLGGGVSTGITLRLENTLLAFEARGGPSFVQCSVGGGNIRAVDANGDALATPIHPTAYVQVVYAQSASATLVDDARFDAIKAKTDALPASPASETTATAIKNKTDALPASPASETTVSAVKAKTDALPASPASETTASAALGAALRASGLLHENAVVDQQTWDGDRLTGARLRCYDSKANAQVGGAAGLLYEYAVAAEYAAGKLARYSIVREQ